MHWFRFAVLLTVVTVLQASFVDAITVSGIRPDLLLILLAFFAIYRNSSDAIITSFSIGFASDLIGTSMGPGMLSFGLLGAGLCYLTRYVSIKRMPYQAAAIFLLGFLTSALAAVLSRLQHQPSLQNTYGMLLGTPLYSAIVGPFLFLPLAWWMRIKIHRYRRRW